MKKEIKILFVDDHSVILKGVVSMLEESSSYIFNITTKSNCDAAYEAIKIVDKTTPFDVIFSDLSFGESQSKIKSGEELIKILNSELPSLKKGVITGHSETNRVYNVIQNTQPSAYLLKDNLNTNELVFAIDQMLKGEKYYTHIVHQKILKRSIVQISRDNVALQILDELPKHPKISNMVGIIKKDDGKELKIRSIENKLSELRITLNAKNNTDLVLKAKELGLID